MGFSVRDSYLCDLYSTTYDNIIVGGDSRVLTVVQFIRAGGLAQVFLGSRPGATERGEKTVLSWGLYHHYY